MRNEEFGIWNLKFEIIFPRSYIQTGKNFHEFKSNDGSR